MGQRTIGPQTSLTAQIYCFECNIFSGFLSFLGQRRNVSDRLLPLHPLPPPVVALPHRRLPPGAGGLRRKGRKSGRSLGEEASTVGGRVRRVRAEEARRRRRRMNWSGIPHLPIPPPLFLTKRVAFCLEGRMRMGWREGKEAMQRLVNCIHW